MNQYKKEVEEIERAFEEGDLDLLRKLLPPLLKRNVPAAVRISASFFDAGTPEDECDRIYVEGMFKAAELGDRKARYQVGVFYDLGEYGIEQDRQKASYIFKELADEGDSHCMWIYACELIWGNGTFPKSIGKGVRLLFEAAENGSANACMTIADFYNEGKLGFDHNIEQRDKYRILTMSYDDTTYDPYA